jgi:hypothetical protein
MPEPAGEEESREEGSPKRQEESSQLVRSCPKIHQGDELIEQRVGQMLRHYEFTGRKCAELTQIASTIADLPAAVVPLRRRAFQL